MLSNMALRHQFFQFEPRGVRSIDNKTVSIYLSGFPGLHPSCLLDLKGQNAYTETYRGGIFI